MCQVPKGMNKLGLESFGLTSVVGLHKRSVEEVSRLQAQPPLSEQTCNDKAVYTRTFFGIFCSQIYQILNESEGRPHNSQLRK